MIASGVLLAIGVVALILAAGYLLRLSFDRGWISPIIVASAGPCRGDRRAVFGGFTPLPATTARRLIGCGAAIIYQRLGRSPLYELLPPRRVSWGWRWCRSPSR